MYYSCSEKKGADQLHGHCEADLRLCFCICRLLVFPRGGSIKDMQKGGYWIRSILPSNEALILVSVCIGGPFILVN